ncbi:MAG: hypothetical protein KKG60_00205 [Nanoarchaeota archaeon]|nr:hypothetical protein [Nanoarchaeota archaeon]
MKLRAVGKSSLSFCELGRELGYEFDYKVNQEERGLQEKEGLLRKGFFDYVMIIGVIGLVLLSISWIAETISLIKHKRSKKKELDLKFSVLYVLGSLCLAVYSVQIKNLIFIILNSVVVLLSTISLVFSVKK